MSRVLVGIFAVFWVTFLAVSGVLIFIQGSIHSSHDRGAKVPRGSLNLTLLEKVTTDTYMERSPNSSEVTLYIANYGANSTREETTSIETSCCVFLGSRGHWRTRNMPVRVYQDETLISLVQTVTDDWNAKTQIDLTGDILMYDGPLTSQERNNAWLEGINVVGYQEIDENGVLAVTILRFTDSSLTHILNSAIIFNSRIPDLCNAANDPQCYDRRSVFNHETGHQYGMGDLYDDACENKLMYFELQAGTTRKRTIDFTSLSCVNELYEGIPLEGEQTPEDLLELNASSPSTTTSLTTLVLSLLVALCGI
jgi:hypothetical protein